MTAAWEPTPAEEEVLLALMLGGHLTEAEIVRRVGISAREVAPLLDCLRRAGSVEARDAPDGVGQLCLTATGRSRADEFLARERAGLAERFEVLLPDFDASNRALKELLHRWQMRSLGGARMVNDHRDPRYDERVLRDLARLLDGAQPWLARLASKRARYARYRERLAAALDRAGRGEIAYVSGLGVDSVHSVWWQLHADLLAVLGRSRSEADT